MNSFPHKISTPARDFWLRLLTGCLLSVAFESSCSFYNQNDVVQPVEGTTHCRKPNQTNALPNAPPYQVLITLTFAELRRWVVNSFFGVLTYEALGFEYIVEFDG
jgi:hypothetical protein